MVNSVKSCHKYFIQDLNVQQIAAKFVFIDWWGKNVSCWYVSGPSRKTAERHPHVTFAFTEFKLLLKGGEIWWHHCNLITGCTCQIQHTLLLQMLLRVVHSLDVVRHDTRELLWRGRHGAKEKCSCHTESKNWKLWSCHVLPVLVLVY